MQPEPDKRPTLPDLEKALRGESTDLVQFVADVHPADLAGFLEELDEAEVVRVLVALDVEGRTELLRFAPDPLSEQLLASMPLDELVDVVEGLPPDEAVDLLALTDDATAEQVLRRVDFDRAEGLRVLARYDAETAGGLMTTEYVSVPRDGHVSDAIKRIKQEERPGGEEEIGVFIVDAQNRPVGFVSDRELLTTNIHTPIDEVMETDLVTVAADADQEEVANLVSKYSLTALPVLGKDGELIGVISSEDAVEVLEEELEEDILRIVGTSPEVLQTRLPVLTRVRHRLPLQALTVVGGLVTAWILARALPGEAGPHEATGVGVGDVLRYLPIIIGLAGNVGIQSSTILVRALATGELTQERQPGVLGSEILVGMIIGFLCGTATMFVSAYMEGSGQLDLLFGASVGSAIAVAVTWAAFLGCLVPVTCVRLGIDPAIVAGPFLITLSDVSGAAIFVGVASLTLELGA